MIAWHPAIRVASIGECMIELFERPDGTLTRAFGGDTLNTALYLARLGIATEYVTALGTDPFSDELLAGWAAEGIGTGLVARVEGTVPGLYLIRTDQQGERSFYYWRDSAPVRRLFELPQTGMIEAAIRTRDLVYLSGVTLSLFDAPARERLFALLQGVRDAGGRVAFDTNFRPRGWPDPRIAREAFDRALDIADIVFASVEDMMLLHGPMTETAILARLHSQTRSELVLKLPTLACRVIEAGTDAMVTASPVADVMDTTAAGDSFAAAYIAARCRGADAIASAHAAHLLAGIVVRYRGAIVPRGAMPDVGGST